MNAGYENLTASQRTRFDQLMTSPMNSWPAGLKQFCESNRPITCGDHLADVVGRWVKQNYC